MKSKFILFILLSLHTTCVRAAAELKKEAEQKTGQALYKGVIKINDDLYVAQAADDAGKPLEKFYLAIERVKDDLMNKWLRYAYRQIQKGEKYNALNKNFITDGAQFLHNTLLAYKFGSIKPSNEVWVAYISDEPIKERGQLLADPEHMKMFVSVITSPNALLTTHAGISRTVNAAVDKQKGKDLRPDESMYLHSFAAKVMKERNPSRLYLITFPNEIMLGIFLKKMPQNTAFLGTDITAGVNNLQNPKTYFPQEVSEHAPGETDEEYERRINLVEERFLKKYGPHQQLFKKTLTSYPPRIKETMNRHGFTTRFTIQMPDSKELIIKRSNKDYQWLFTEFFQGNYVPYVLIDLGALANLKKLASE